MKTESIYIADLIKSLFSKEYTIDVSYTELEQMSKVEKISILRDLIKNSTTKWMKYYYSYRILRFAFLMTPVLLFLTTFGVSLLTTLTIMISFASVSILFGKRFQKKALTERLELFVFTEMYEKEMLEYK